MTSQVRWDRGRQDYSLRVFSFRFSVKDQQGASRPTPATSLSGPGSGFSGPWAMPSLLLTHRTMRPPHTDSDLRPKTASRKPKTIRRPAVVHGLALALAGCGRAPLPTSPIVVFASRTHPGCARRWPDLRPGFGRGRGSGFGPGVRTRGAGGLAPPARDDEARLLVVLGTRPSCWRPRW